MAVILYDLYIIQIIETGFTPMNLRTLKKYRSFIGDNEFFKEFIPEYEFIQEDESDDQVDVYSFHMSPKYINAELRNYQIEGVNWLISMHENNINCILADEMGLGKTLQTITFLGYIRFIKNERVKQLIVVPKSTLNNWQCEFKKFLPRYKVKMFHCSKKDIKKEGKKLTKRDWDACLTTFEMCLIGKNELRKVCWSYVIIDEAHRIKNENSVLSQMVRMFSCDHRLLLTGTPLQNNIHELWALLNFIVPDIFHNAAKFENFVMNVDKNQGDSVLKLRKVLQLFFLRREKCDVETTLLPKKVVNLYAKLTSMQRDWYKMILERDLSPIRNINANIKSALLNVVMQLRKCCNHPYLFVGAEPEPFTNGQHIIDNSGKMILLDKLLTNLRAKGSRVLIFSQMTTMLDILEDYANLKEYEYCRLDGSTLTEDRTNAIDEFNAPDSSKFIFLLTTRAGGLGINLTSADTVIIYDSDWNPQMDLQAQDRAHRIGQKKQVCVFRLITENTIEERIVYRSLQKLKLDDILVQKGNKVTNTLNQNELLDILASGIDIDSKDEAEVQNIEEIFKFGETRTLEMNKKLSGLNIMDTVNTCVDVYEWEGENYSTKKIERFITSKIDSSRASRASIFSRNLVPKVETFPDYLFYPKEIQEIQEEEKRLFTLKKEPSEELLKKKKELMKKGFDWTKKDFLTFIKAMETEGKDNLDRICEIMSHKDDVREYYEVFWKRAGELNDSEKILNQIERAERKKEKGNKIKKVILEHAGELDELFYRSKFGSCNKFLLLMYQKYYDDPSCFDLICRDVKLNQELRFDYVLLSRTPAELARHIYGMTRQLLKMYSY